METIWANRHFLNVDFQAFLTGTQNKNNFHWCPFCEIIILKNILIFRAQQFCSKEICSGLHYDDDIYEDLNDDGNILIHPYAIIFLMLSFLSALLMVAVKIGQIRLALKTPGLVSLLKTPVISAPKNLDKMGLNLTLLTLLCTAAPLKTYLNK